MKRLALALLLIAAPVSAKTLVIAPNQLKTDIATSDAKNSSDNIMRLLTNILDRITDGQGGGSYGYRIVMATAINTIDARSGVVRWGLGTGAQASETFDAVVDVAQFLGNMGAGNYRLDSLLMIRNADYSGPTVPHLVVFSDRQVIRGSAPTFSSSACSTGVVADNVGGVALDCGQIIYVPGSTRTWIGGGIFNATCPASNTVPSCGIRKLLCMGTGNYPQKQRFSVPTQMAWYDSLGSYANNDSLVLWEIPFSINYPLKNAVFVFPDGNGGFSDSLSANSDNPETIPCEGDMSLMLAGLARLDSLSGHRVFSPTKLPIKLGVAVSAAFCRTSNRAGPGIIPSDSSVVKATIDSLASLNGTGGVQIKLTVGVNSDSLQGVCVSELGWWRRLGPNVRFSPQPWRGTKSLTAGNGDGNAGWNAGAFQSIDMMGIRRSRFYYGGSFVPTLTGDAGDKDTSIAMSLIMAKYNMALAGIRSEEMSRTLVPTLYDWWPKNAVPKDIDSLIYVLGKCGITTVVSDGQSWAGELGRGRRGILSTGMAPYGISTAGALGYTQRQCRLRSSIDGSSISVLSHAGYGINGGRRDLISCDSATTTQTLAEVSVLHEIARTWSGLLGKSVINGDYRTQFQLNFGDNPCASIFDNWAPVIDFENNRPGRAFVRALNAADFSGVPSGPPSRPAWWILKSVKNAMDAINGFNGRTVITFDYPENINPEQ